MQTFRNHLGDEVHSLGRLAQIDASRQRRMISVPYASELDVEQVFFDERRIGPRQMRRRTDFSDHRIGRLARKRPAEFRRARRCHPIDLGHDVALPYAGPRGVESGLLRRGGDLAGLPHEIEFPVRLHHPAPIDQQESIDEFAVRQVLAQDRIPLRRIVIVVAFDTDRPVVPAAALDLFGDELHGMEIGGGDVLVRIGDDVALIEKRGELCTDRVHLSADPDRLFLLQAHRYHLRRIERPAVVTRQPELICRRCDQQQLHATLNHRTLNARNARLVFLVLEQQHIGPLPGYVSRS